MKSFFKFRKSSADISDWGRHDDKLLAAVEAKNLEKVDVLMTKKGTSPTKLHPQGFTVFHRAATQGALEVVNLLLAHRADTNAVDSHGRTALHCASRNGHARVVEKLVQVNNNAFAGDHHELTALHHACLGGSLEATKVLLQFDAPLSYVDKDGRTPLFIAAQMEHPTICKELLEKGADVNAMDHTGRTALMLASEHGNKVVCEYLIRKGGDPFFSDDQGHTAWWYAERNGHKDILRILEQGPARAAWSQDKEDTLHISVTPPETAPITEFCLNQKKAHHRRQGNGMEDPFEHGIIPIDQYQDIDSYALEDAHTLSEVSSIVTALAPQGNTRPSIAASSHLPPICSTGESSHVLITSASSHIPCTMVMSHLTGQPNTGRAVPKQQEAYKELEEEHDMLSVEMQRVAVENNRLQDRVQHLEKRLEAILDPVDETRCHFMDSVSSPVKLGFDDDDDDKPEQSSVDAVVIESMEEELEGLQSSLNAERDRNLALEDQIRQLRKQLDTSSKPEAEQDSDADSWNDSEEELFGTPGKRRSNSDEDGKTIAVLRSQLLVLTKENEQLQQALEVGNLPASSLLDEECGGEENAVDLRTSSASDTLGLLHDVTQLHKENATLAKQLEDTEMECIKLRSSNTSLEQQLQEAQEAYSRLKGGGQNEVSLNPSPEFVTYIDNHDVFNQWTDLDTKLEVQSKNFLKSNGASPSPPPVNGTSAEFSELACKYESLKAQYDKVLLDNEEKQTRNEQLSLDIVEIHGQVHELEELAEFNESLQEQNTHLKEELEKYKSMEFITNGSLTKNDALALLNVELQQENNDLKSENRTLLGQLKEVQKTMENSLASKQLQNKHVEESDFTGKIVELKAQVMQAQNTITRQEQTILRLQEQERENTKLREDYDSLLQESENFKDSIEELQDLLKQQTEVLSSEKESLYQRNLELEQENALLHKQVDLKNKQTNAQNNSTSRKKHLNSKIPVKERTYHSENTAEAHRERMKDSFEEDVIDIDEQEQGLWEEVVGRDETADDPASDQSSLDEVDQRICDLQKQVSRLQRQLAETDQQHRDVISTYRTHLLTAVQGRMDPEVMKALRHIIKLRSTEQFC